MCFNSSRFASSVVLPQGDLGSLPGYDTHNQVVYDPVPKSPLPEIPVGFLSGLFPAGVWRRFNVQLTSLERASQE